MSEETIEQTMERLKREDEVKERAFQKRLEEFDAEARRYRAEKEEEQRSKERAVEKELREKQERREQEMKDSALHSWVVSGGSEEDFGEAWPSLKVEMLKARTLEAEERSRIATQRHMRSTF